MSSDGTSVPVTWTVDPEPQQIALLRPPVVVAVSSLTAIPPTPPVGLAYIAAALEVSGHAVQVIDSPSEAMQDFEDIEAAIGTIRRIGLSPTEMVAEIAEGTTIIGVTNMFAHEWPTVRELVELARQRFPDATIIVGGDNATGFWQWMFQQTSVIDAIVLGEGDATVVELVARIAAGLPYAGMEGVATPAGDTEPTSGGLPIRFKKLDGIPPPAWHLFKMASYFADRSSFGVDRGRTMPILATRGCPYKCTFCSSPQMWTTRYVVRDPDDVADEIADYVERYDIRNVDFVDLTPITKRKWSISLCTAVKERGLDISMQLPIGTRSEAIDKEVIEALKSAGVTNITFAPETGSERMLEIYDKRADLDHILESVRLASREGMVTNMHMIVGHPAETWKDRWLSWKFMIKAAFRGLHYAGGTLFHPYPGSKDFIDLVESGQLTVDDDYCYDGLARGAKPSQSWNPELNPKALHWARLAMVTSTLAVTYILHPGRVVHMAKNRIWGGDEETVVEQSLNMRRRGVLSKSRTAPSDHEAVPSAVAERHPELV